MLDKEERPVVSAPWIFRMTFILHPGLSVDKWRRVGVRSSLLGQEIAPEVWRFLLRFGVDVAE